LKIIYYYTLISLETACEKTESFLTPLNIINSKNLVSIIIRVTMAILVISPWLFMIFRNNIHGTVTKKVADFYDDNFSCKSSCENICPDISESKIGKYSLGINSL